MQTRFRRDTDSHKPVATEQFRRFKKLRLKNNIGETKSPNGRAWTLAPGKKETYTGEKGGATMQPHGQGFYVLGIILSIIQP